MITNKLAIKMSQIMRKYNNSEKPFKPTSYLKNKFNSNNNQKFQINNNSKLINPKKFNIIFLKYKYKNFLKIFFLNLKIKNNKKNK